MRKNRSIVAILAVMLLMLSGCGDSGKTQEAEVETEVETEVVSDDLAIHKQMLLDTNSICGVIYCGFVPDTVDKLADDIEYVNQILDESGYEGIYDFVRNIPKERIVEVPGGYELYCIYPFDEKASVVVNKLVLCDGEEFSVDVDEVLYRSDRGEPILIRCNVSEIFADTEVNIVDNDGNELKWNPMLSGKDGHIAVPDGEVSVYDGTPY